eukprot:sb/3475794/
MGRRGVLLYLKSEHREWILMFRDNYEKSIIGPRALASAMIIFPVRPQSPYLFHVPFDDKTMEYIWEVWSEIFHCRSPELLFSRAYPATKEWNGPNAVWKRYDEFLTGALQSRDNSEFEFLGDD